MRKNVENKRTLNLKNKYNNYVFISDLKPYYFIKTETQLKIT